MIEKKQTILFVGNHFTTKNHNKNVWHYLVERLQDAGWHVITTSNKIPKLLRILDMVWTIILKARKYSLAQVDVFSGSAFIWAEACVNTLSLLNKKTILMLHGGGLPEFGQEYPTRMRRLLSKADLVVAPSHFLEQTMSDWHKDIVVIPNPIDIGSYPYRNRQEVKPTIIWVRAFHEIYNPMLAIQALKLLIGEWPSSQLIMVGPDKGDGCLQHCYALSKDLGISEKIIFTGKLPHHQLPPLLSEADIFINTTNFDNAPSSLIEAMACGLCLISTNVGGIPWMIENEKEALLIQPNNPGELFTAISRVLNDHILASHLSANAYKKAKGFDWSIILPKWEDAYNQVISNV